MPRVSLSKPCRGAYDASGGRGGRPTPWRAGGGDVCKAPHGAQVARGGAGWLVHPSAVASDARKGGARGAGRRRRRTGEGLAPRPVRVGCSLAQHFFCACCTYQPAAAHAHGAHQTARRGESSRGSPRRHRAAEPRAA